MSFAWTTPTLVASSHVGMRPRQDSSGLSLHNPRPWLYMPEELVIETAG